MLTTRVYGIAIQAVRNPSEDCWEVTIMPEREVMDRPFDLRSTYSGPDPILPLSAAMSDVVEWASDYAIMNL